MLDMEKLIELRKVLNFKYICEQAGLRYGTINKRIYDHLKNPENGEISPKEAQKILEGLKKCNLVWNDPNCTNLNPKNNLPNT